MGGLEVIFLARPHFAAILQQFSIVTLILAYFEKVLTGPKCRDDELQVFGDSPACGENITLYTGFVHVPFLRPFYGQRKSYVKLRSIVMGIHHVTPICSNANICKLNQPIETRNHR